MAIMAMMTTLLDRFDARWRLLVRALLSGGFHTALGLFHKQQRANSHTALEHFIQALCKDEVTCPAPEERPLALKPLVCLFPTSFKQNLLAFVYHLHHVLPPSTVSHLLECIKQDFTTNSWLTSLVTQLERQLDIDKEKPLFSAQCDQRLTQLLHPLPSSDDAGGWATCFHLVSLSAPQSGSTLLRVASQRKRKRSDVNQNSDSEEISQQTKLMRIDLCVGQDVCTEQELSKKEEHSAPDAIRTSEAINPPPDVPLDTLSENIKVAVLQLKDLIENDSEWDQSASDVVNVLNDCDPNQLEVVCSTINLPNVPEHILPKLCSSVLALSPDFSFSTAATFIRSLLLNKILSLSEPASRCLVSTVTSLCSRYPRPMCHAIFESVLEDKNIGNLQADLLNKLVEVCLDSHYKLLALQMTFKVQWTDAVLSIIHCLLDSKLDINEDLFTRFTEQLVCQASQLTKSVKFAKMLLTVLTKYSTSITTAHKHTLSNCLMLNDTFLKKSLQAALKRISHN